MLNNYIKPTVFSQKKEPLVFERLFDKLKKSLGTTYFPGNFVGEPTT